MPRRYYPLGYGTQNAARGCHQQSCRHAFIGHISDHEAQAVIVEVDKVIKVAADLPGRLVVRVYVPTWERGQIFGQQRFLDELGNAQFVLDALVCTRLHLLIAHKLGDAHSGCRLRSQGIEKPAVVCRVILLTKTWTQVQQANQLTLADQRYSYLDASSLQSL